MKSAAGVFIQPVQGETGLPQRERVVRALRQAIAGGALAAGDRLPGARQMAADWQVARAAVDEAYALLQMEGLLERRVGDGTYVAVPARPPRQPTAAAQRVLQRSAVLGCAPVRLEAAWTTMRVPPLHPRATDLDAFPLDTWRRLLLQAHADVQRGLLDAVAPAGLPALREAIARHLGVHRGVRCSAAQVLVVNGPGEGLEVVARLLCAPGDTVWLEDPSHPSLPPLLRTLGLQVVGVPLDEQGFDTPWACRHAPAARLAYLHPLMQYPLGLRTRTARTEALLAWAARRGGWIVEGHFNDETVPAVQQPPSMFAVDPHGRVVLMGTFEGVMFPSLRVAYLVLPPAIAADFTAAAARLGQRVPLPVQWAAAEFIDRGHLTAHLQRLRADVLRRREIVRTRLLPRLPQGVCAGPMNAGTHLALHLPPACSDVALAGRLRKRGLIVEPLSLLAWQARGLNGLVLGYGGHDDAVLARGLDAIAEAVCEGGCGACQPAGEKA